MLLRQIRVLAEGGWQGCARVTRGRQTRWCDCFRRYNNPWGRKRVSPVKISWIITKIQKKCSVEIQILEWWAAIDDGAPHRCPTNVHTTATTHRKRPSRSPAIWFICLFYPNQIDIASIWMGESLIKVASGPRQHGGGRVVGLSKGNLGQANTLV